MASTETAHDVVIVGAGPAGLSLAAALARHGLNTALVERQPETALAAPEFDGREIALTHRSVALLRELGAWDRIAAADISPLGEARVLNGSSAHALHFAPPASQADALGQLVPNHQIRRALFEQAITEPKLQLFAGSTATDIAQDRHAARITLADGRKLAGRLVVAADTRFSELRRRVGIPARMRDFGRTMLVCRMAHAAPHDQVATEWFAYGQTVAILPLNGTAEAPHQSSLVLTLPAQQIAGLLALSPEAFAAEITARYQQRLGAMRLVSTRHAYPLVGVYADRFVGERFALLGDAAVGMHPVTAHGFNLGLAGQERLARLIIAAATAGRDIGAPGLLLRYEAGHRRATRPLYLATNATALLYADDRLPARLLRSAVIRLGEGLPPFRQAVVARLMQAGAAGRPSLLRALMP